MIRLVIAEQQRGKLHRASWEAVAFAQELAGEQPVEAVVLGVNPADAASELSQAAVAAVHVLDSPLLEPYTADAYTGVLQQAIAELKPTHVVFPHTYRTRDFAPKLAARLDRALITDCIGIKNGDKPAFLRPVYQGKLVAEVTAEGERPHLASVQVGAYRADSAKRGSAAAPVKAMTASLAAADIRQKAEEPFQEAKQAVDLSQAERIVAVGRGIKAQEHIALAEKLAARAGGAAGGIQAYLRQRLAAHGAAGGQLGTDRGAEALRRARYLRRHPARRRHERRAHHRRYQQRPGRAHLRDRRLRHRRRSLRDRTGDDR